MISFQSVLDVTNQGPGPEPVFWNQECEVYYNILSELAPPEAQEKWRGQAERIGAPFTLQVCKSIEATLPDVIHASLIDGDHYTAGVTTDCSLVFPRVPVGGVVLAHDYQNYGCPEVAPAMDAWLAGEPDRGRTWKFIGLTWTLAAWRRVV